MTSGRSLLLGVFVKASKDVQFPCWVYVEGTGKIVNETGLCAADGVLVNSAEELAALGIAWCTSPVEALPKKAAPATVIVEEPVKPVEEPVKSFKKVK